MPWKTGALLPTGELQSLLTQNMKILMKVDKLQTYPGAGFKKICIKANTFWIDKHSTFIEQQKWMFVFIMCRRISGLAFDWGREFSECLLSFLQIADKINKLETCCYDSDATSAHRMSHPQQQQRSIWPPCLTLVLDNWDEIDLERFRKVIHVAGMTFCRILHPSVNLSISLFGTKLRTWE